MSGSSDSSKTRTHGMMAFTELASTNPSETRKFLEKTFGWKFDSVQMPTGPYLTFQNPKGTTAGIRATQKSEIPGSTNYVLVENLDEAERNVRKKGGQIVLPRTDIPGMGSFFWFKIPSGLIMACWQDSKKTLTWKVAALVVLGSELGGSRLSSLRAHFLTDKCDSRKTLLSCKSDQFLISI